METLKMRNQVLATTRPKMLFINHMKEHKSLKKIK